MGAGLADMHCHLELYEDMLGIAARCAQRGIRILAVTASPRSWRRFTDRIQMFDNVKVGLGLHPQLGDHLIDDLQLFEKLLPNCKYIGEIGLDAGRDFARTFVTQTKVFRRVLRLCSENPGKVLSIHSVRSSTQVLSLLERDFDFSSGKAILHWFTGSPDQTRRAVDMGCYFSVNSQMLRSESGRALVSRLPVTRILTESDGPFVMERGRSATPLDIEAVLRAIAVLRKVDPSDFALRLADNLRLVVS